MYQKNVHARSKALLHIQEFFSRHSVANSPASMYVRRPCTSGVHVLERHRLHDAHPKRMARGASPAAGESKGRSGRAEPLCARIDGANREVSEGKADL